jgi:hypothetical protein
MGKNIHLRRNALRIYFSKCPQKLIRPRQEGFAPQTPVVLPTYAWVSCLVTHPCPHSKWRANTFKRMAETGPRLANIVRL